MARVIAAEWVPQSFIYWPGDLPVPGKTTTLVAVAGGRVYHDYALDLMKSARDWFRPTEHVHTLILEGEEGWPIGTMCRHRVLTDAFPASDYVWLCDADMRFEAPVGPEILPPGEHGIAAVRHPGYITMPAYELPYDRNPLSWTHMTTDQGDFYYAGGFIGGTNDGMRKLSRDIAEMLERDQAHNVIPRWHDESALNRLLWQEAPTVILDPSYVYPDNDVWYRTVWPEQYERRLVALDKTADERGQRD